MRAALVAALLFAALAAGCSSPAAKPGASGDPTTGAVLGVVVDERIAPIEGAKATLRGGAGGEQTAITDAKGLFAFRGLAPATYFITVSHLLYSPSQTSVTVQPGVSDPPVTRIQVNRLFTREAYSEVSKFNGYIQCGYSLPPVIETQCVDDYTRFVQPGGVAPQLKSVADHRFYLSAVGAGWQTIVLELNWEPTAQGTSQAMFLSTSHYNRTGTDWFANVDGPSPLLARLEVGEAHSTHSGTPDRIPAEGIPDLYTFAGIHGDLPAVGFSQSFTLFQHNFYYGKPPADWSFVKGDPVPF